MRRVSLSSTPLNGAPKPRSRRGILLDGGRIFVVNIERVTWVASSKGHVCVKDSPSLSLRLRLSVGTWSDSDITATDVYLRRGQTATKESSFFSFNPASTISDAASFLKAENKKKNRRKTRPTVEKDGAQRRPGGKVKEEEKVESELAPPHRQWNCDASVEQRNTDPSLHPTPE